MMLTMDPRDRTRMPQITGLVSAPRRPLWLIGAGSLGLVAFTYGAFAFFGDLADPRARTPRPRMPPVTSAAVTMPDLARDGVPALTSTPASTQPTVSRPPEPPASAAVALRSDREEAPAAPRETPVPREMPIPPWAAEPASEPASRRASKPVVPIENATVVKPEVRQAAVIAPLRLSTPIAPAKAETVRAKLAEERPAPPSPPSPSPDAPAKRASVAKPPREKPAVRAASAESATPAAAAPARTTARQAEPEDDDIGTKIGSKVSSGIKAIGGLLTGD